MCYNHRLKNRKLKVKDLGVATIMICSLFLSTVSAQESLNATGDDATGNGGSVSYSLGQVVYQTQAGTSGSGSEGVQQPYEISVATGIEEAEGRGLSVLAYPNPTTDYLTLKIEASTAFRDQSLAYQLYDMGGKLLQSQKITGSQISINMNGFEPAVYFLKVLKTQGKESQQGFFVVKTFKIIKNQ